MKNYLSRLFRKLTLKQRFLVAPFFGLIACSLLIAAFIIESKSQNYILSHIAGRELSVFNSYSKAFVKLTEQHITLDDLIHEASQYNGEELNARIEDHLAKLRAAISDLEQALPPTTSGEGPELAGLRRELLANTQAYRKGAGAAIRMVAHNPRVADALLEHADEQFTAMNRSFVTLLALERSKIGTQIAERVSENQRRNSTIAIVGISILVILFLLSHSLSRILSHSIDEQIDILTELGQKAGADATINSGSEVERMTRAVAAFRQSLLALHESERRFGAMLENVKLVSLMLDREGEITYCNDYLLTLTGWKREEVIGQDWFKMFVPPGAGQMRDTFDALLTNVPAAWHLEDEILTRAGSRRLVRWNNSVLRSGAGVVVGTASIGEDITELKQSEAALQRLNEELEQKVETRTRDLQRAQSEAIEANQAKSSFLAAMSHEIRTPMNGVVGMIDVLHQSSLKGEQIEMIDLIRESAFSLLGIINDILDFSKIEAGKLELEKEPLSITEVVEGVCGMLDRIAHKKDVGLLVYVDPAIPSHVWGDALRLRQVLINLANNAIKFSSDQPRTGKVAVRALLIKQISDHVTVEFQIVDNGIGMDEETRARLFKAFAQADVSTTRRFGGTGLGLAIASNLAELMGGQIDVQSEVGLGSTFKICLPFMIPSAMTRMMETQSEVAGLSCVVVGRSGGVADDLGVYLTHASAIVERAQDLEQAKMQAAGRAGLSIWIVDAWDDPHPPARIQAARNELEQDVRVVVVLVERGKRRRPRAISADMITVDGNALTRRMFLRAVAAAAGRMSLDQEEDKQQRSGLAMIAPSRAEALQQGRLILIAEDNETNQKVICRQLGLLGYTADVANDGWEALARWRKERYALLLTDLHMPKMDGYELAQAIRAEEKDGRRIPIVALTANALKGEADRCRAVGMDDYRSKPSPLAELKSVLEHWLPVAQVLADASLLSVTATDIANPAVPLDVNVLKSLVGDDPELVREFLQDFRTSARQTAMDLDVACKNEEAAQVGALAHKLKSAARSVGALALGELCAQMEEEGKARDNEALAILIERFQAEMTAVEEYLATFLQDKPIRMS